MIFNIENKTKDIPYYEFKYGVLTMEGNVYPNDSTEFWKPIIRELEGYMETKQPIILNFKFHYYNTASMYYIDLVFRMLREYSKFAGISVNWFYLENDEDMQIYGEDYKKSSKIIDFKLIEIKK